MNLCVLLIKTYIIITILHSSQLKDKTIKIAIVLYLILLPYSDEIYNNVCNLQWWLITFMLAIILKKDNLSSILMSSFFLVITSLTGVNSVILIPACFYLILVSSRNIYKLIKAIIPVFCGFLQLYLVSFSNRVSEFNYLGGGINDIVNVVVNRIILNTFYNFNSDSLLNYLILLSYCILIAYLFFKFRKESDIVFIFIFSFTYFFVISFNLLKIFYDLNSDLKPLIYGLGCERYFVFLRLCTFAVFITSVKLIFNYFELNKNIIINISYNIALLAVISLNFFIVFPFENRYYSDTKEFQNAESGESVTFHFPPNWSCTLVKR